MSTFGILSLFAFVIIVGGLAALMFYGADDQPIAKIMLGALYCLIGAQLALVIIRYPCYVIDGIVFISMGYKMLANVMFVIFAVILLFLLGLFLAKLPWEKLLKVTTPKLIVCGVLLLCLFTYTELFNGMGSFDNYEEFRSVKASYGRYDVHFWPTKLIKYYSKRHEQDCVAVYPFDVRTASGKQPFVYRVDIFFTDGMNDEEYYEEYDDGLTVSMTDGDWVKPVEPVKPVKTATYNYICYYPFTWKSYEGSEPVAFSDTDYVPEATEEIIHLSASDAVSETEAVMDSVTE